MASVELARQQWEEGDRRLRQEAGEGGRADDLYAHVEAIAEEVRRRVGETFTLADLARVYEHSDEWSRQAVAERAPAGDWLRTLADAQAAAFHRYARGAVDYQP